MPTKRSFMIPDKLIEFVRIPAACPSWAKELRVWYNGPSLDYNVETSSFAQTGSSYMLSIASDLVRALRQFESIGWANQLARNLGFKSSQLESSNYYNKFHTFEEVCEFLKEMAYQYAIPEGSEIACSIMPFRGSPWDFAEEQTYYFSSKKNKMIESTPPPIRMSTYIKDSEEITTPIIDWCKITPTVKPSPGAGPGDLAMSFRVLSDARGDYALSYLVSHCFSNLDGIRKAYKECGGLLWPSLGVGLLPTTNFGPFVLISDPEIILQGLKPYRRSRGEYPVYVYKKDTWTVTTSSLMGNRGAEALEEWVGYDTGNIYNKFSLLLSFEGSGPGEPVEPLRNTKQLRSRLNAIRKKWNDPTIDVESIPFDSDVYYPFCEAKVNGVVTFDCFSVAFCPSEYTVPFRRTLRRMGFKGSVFGVDLNAENLSKQEQFDYAWAIRDKLLQLVRRFPSKEHIVDL